MHSADQTKQMLTSALVRGFAIFVLNSAAGMASLSLTLRVTDGGNHSFSWTWGLLTYFVRQFYDTSDTNSSLSLRQLMRRFVTIGVLQSINLPTTTPHADDNNTSVWTRKNSNLPNFAWEFRSKGQYLAWIMMMVAVKMTLSLQRFKQCHPKGRC